MRLRATNIAFPLFLTVFFFLGCNTKGKLNFSFLPISLTSTERQISEAYHSYIELVGETEFPLTNSQTENEILFGADYNTNIIANPDLLYFPATLWQMYILTEDASWEEQATMYTKAMQKAVSSGIRFNGEVIQSLFLKSYESNRDKEMLDLIIRTLSQYITELEANNSAHNMAIAIDTYLNLLVENEIFFFATKETGDPAFRNFALENSTVIYDKYFKEDLRIMSVLMDDIAKENLKVLKTHDFKKLACGMNGFLALYSETGNIEYLQFCEKIAFIFECLYNPEDQTLENKTKQEIDKKIDLVSKSHVSLALLNLSKLAKKSLEEISTIIYSSILNELEIQRIGMKNLGESHINSEKDYSFKLFFYLLEYELRKQNLIET